MDPIEIVRLLRIKDEKALSYLYDNYSGALNGIIKRIIKSEKQAEEILQQTFLNIWENIALYDESKSQLYTWMSRIAKNAAIDVRRLKKYENLKNTDSLNMNIHNKQGYLMSLASVDVESLIEQIDVKHKIVLDYTYLNGYTQCEPSNLPKFYGSKEFFN